MSFFLKITAGKNAGNEFLLQPGRNLVGRSRSADIRVFNEDVSGKHFYIEVSENGAVLQNLSSYGTKIDGVLVHKESPLSSGQVIEAGTILKFLFEETNDNDQAQIQNIDTTQVTKLIGESQKDDSDDQNLSAVTAVTKFASEAEEGEMTSVTKFASEIEEGEMTSVTKFASEIEEGEMTSVTKFASEIEEGEMTSVTKFASEVEEGEMTSVTNFASEVEEGEMTSVTKFASEVEEGEMTSVTNFASEVETDEKTTASDVKSDVSEFSGFGQTKDESSASETKLSDTQTILETIAEEKENESFYGGHTIYTFDHEEKSDDLDVTVVGDTLDEQDFFDEDDLDDSEKTSTNETQVVQTRMASMDEINFIKNQLKRQQQSRFFFKFLIFCVFAVLLGIIWMMKSPPREKVLSWPYVEKNGNKSYQTGYMPAFGKGSESGGFDIYYPKWSQTKILNKSPDYSVIHTYLGKDADVPLYIHVSREVMVMDDKKDDDKNSLVFEDREVARKNMKTRLIESSKDQFNFDNSVSVDYLGNIENGILVERFAYQRDAGKSKSYFGILRFFRNADCNYIIRAEVPSEEKLRALPVLLGDTFVYFSRTFIRQHWEGAERYKKGNLKQSMEWIQKEFPKNSPTQYPDLEKEIKGVLAKSKKDRNTAVYNEAMKMLEQLRERQQLWYNGQKILWKKAVIDKDAGAKDEIRRRSIGVFSLPEDKRNFDISRDYWE